MRNLKRLFATLGLAAALALPVLAGEIQTGSPQPSPPASPADSIATSNGAVGAVDSLGIDGSITGISLNLLQCVLFLV